MSFYPNPRPYRLGLVPDGDAGIEATLKVMVELARQYEKDPGIVEKAGALVRDVPPGDRFGEVKALHAFVRDKIRYTNDPVHTELVREPPAVLQLGVGDCDDKALLLGTLLTAIGRHTRFVALAVDGPAFSHVLVESPIGRGWMPLETIVPGAPAGWYPPGVTRRMIANV